MAHWTYPEALHRLLKDEGGYTNDPHDPGGATNFGITIADYRKYIDADGTPADVRNMTEAQASRIYDAHYATPIHYKELDAGVDYSVFDYGVNSGIGRAGKVLRRIVGLPSNTSVIDATVLAAVAKRDSKAIINAIHDERTQFLKSLSTCQYYCKGWLPRVNRVTSASLAFNDRKPHEAPVSVPTRPDENMAKATVPEPKTIKNVVKGSAPTVTIEEGIRDPSWLDWIWAHPIETGIILVGVVVMVAVVVRAINKWHKHVQEEPMPNTLVVPETK